MSRRLGRVAFGDLGGTTPTSRLFGFDRGLPIDRWYVERFLGSNAVDIHGRVLEVADRGRGDWWRFTRASLERLLAEQFGPTNVQVGTHGNVKSAVAFLHGLACDDLRASDLEAFDADYELVLTPRRCAREAPGRRRRGGLIMPYHRVAALEADPQLLAVTPGHFAEHLDVLRRHALATPLRSVRDAGVAARGLPPVAVTFDDGYADNLHAALPVFEAAEAHATLFVVSGAVGTEHEFWWDDVERALLGEGKRPARLELTAGGERLSLDLGTSRPDANGWHVLRPDTPTARHAAYRALVTKLHALEPAARAAAVDELRSRAGLAAAARRSHLPLREEELLRLAESERADVGAHTVRHPSLAVLPFAGQREEVAASKARLEELLGREVATFSYPFGGPAHYTPETVSAVADAGFELACANVEGRVLLVADRYQLPRFLVRDWDGDEFERRLRSWLRR
ncbi:MAG TPA: polysaccharide deacetylase family protein [Gaiellaceae bacterium]|nr:polysaccharide deacetylase family protein [Gaiellaceae bacterium]